MWRDDKTCIYYYHSTQVNYLIQPIDHHMRVPWTKAPALNPQKRWKPTFLFLLGEESSHSGKGCRCGGSARLCRPWQNSSPPPLSLHSLDDHPPHHRRRPPHYPSKGSAASCRLTRPRGATSPTTFLKLLAAQFKAP